MKLIKILFAAALFCMIGGTVSAATLADFNGDKSVSAIINDYKPQNVITTSDDNYNLNGGAKERVMSLVTRLTQIGALLAILGIAYSGYLMVTSTGDDEKTGQGKKGLIWSAVGFAAMILAGPAVNAIINISYSTL